MNVKDCILQHNHIIVLQRAIKNSTDDHFHCACLYLIKLTAKLTVPEMKPLQCERKVFTLYYLVLNLITAI